MTLRTLSCRTLTPNATSTRSQVTRLSSGTVSTTRRPGRIGPKCTAREITRPRYRRILKCPRQGTARRGPADERDLHGPAAPRAAMPGQRHPRCAHLEGVERVGFDPGGARAAVCPVALAVVEQQTVTGARYHAVGTRTRVQPVAVAVGRPVERVRPVAADHPVGALVAHQPVGRCGSDHHVRSRAADQVLDVRPDVVVLAGRAVARPVADAEPKRHAGLRIARLVVPGTAGEQIRTRSAVEAVIAPSG